MLCCRFLWVGRFDVVNSFRRELPANAAAGLELQECRPGDAFAVAVDLADTAGNVEDDGTHAGGLTMIRFFSVQCLLLCVCPAARLSPRLRPLLWWNRRIGNANAAVALCGVRWGAVGALNMRSAIVRYTGCSS